MLRVILGVVLLSVSASAQVYSGPRCLGPYCIDRRTSTRHVLKGLGTTVKVISRSASYCFRTKDGPTFLYLDPIEVDPEAVADVFVSDFENCLHMPVRETSTDLRRWRTPEGIGLGSMVGEVLTAYGKPVAREKVTSETARLRVHGYRVGDTVTRMADERLFYRDAFDDLSAAEFGIRDGKVSYIWLSYNE